METRFLGAMMLALALAGCAPVQPLDVAAFNATNAYHHVERLVAFGPRPSGSPELSRAGDYIAEQLRAAGLEVEEQVFHAATPRGPMQFRNLVGRSKSHRSGSGPVIVFGSHYDTKWMPSIKMVGANDGGSSTGVLLEMARVAADRPDLWFAFFDGEECLVEFGTQDGLEGSRFFVENLKAERQVGRVKAMILLDMVGAANLHITLPANGSRDLMEQLFAAARELGYRDSFSYVPTEMLDDHVPFLDAGIPALDIIGFDYGSAPGRNDYWHTDRDTLDKLDVRSLEITGRTALRLAEAVSRAAVIR